MNRNKLLILVAFATSLLCSVTNTIAATTSSLTLNIDWDSLSYSPGMLSQVPFLLPHNGVLGPNKEAQVSLEMNNTPTSFNSDSGYYSEPATAGVAATNQSASALIDAFGNSQIVSVSSAHDGTGPSLGAKGETQKMQFFEGTSNGLANFSVDYSIHLNLNAESVAQPDFSSASAGYSLSFGLGSVSQYLASLAIGTNEDDAINGAFINEDIFEDLDTYNCTDCSFTQTFTGTLEFFALVTEGETYWINTEAQGFAYTDASITAVPAPAAVWLFASGLLGLIRLPMRKKST